MAEYLRGFGIIGGFMSEIKRDGDTPSRNGSENKRPLFRSLQELRDERLDKGDSGSIGSNGNMLDDKEQSSSALPFPENSARPLDTYNPGDVFMGEDGIRRQMVKGQGPVVVPEDMQAWRALQAKNAPKSSGSSAHAAETSTEIADADTLRRSTIGLYQGEIATKPATFVSDEPNTPLAAGNGNYAEASMTASPGIKLNGGFASGGGNRKPAYPGAYGGDDGAGTVEDSTQTKKKKPGKKSFWNTTPGHVVEGGLALLALGLGFFGLSRGGNKNPDSNAGTTGGAGEVDPTNSPVPPTATNEIRATVTPTAQPTNTETPPATSTEEPTLISLITEAQQSGEDEIKVFDPQGVEVVVDVPPAEMIEGMEWSWVYRGFTKVENGVRSVVRKTGSGFNELEVVDELDLTDKGWGIWTLEGNDIDPNFRFNQSQESKDGLLRYLERYYGQTDVVPYPEIMNLDNFSGQQVPRENLALRGGASIYKLSESESGMATAGLKPLWKWNLFSNAGRPILPTLYKGDVAITEIHTANTLGLLQWVSGRPNETSINAMLSREGTPLRKSGGGFPPDTLMAIAEFTGQTDNVPSRLDEFVYQLFTLGN